MNIRQSLVAALVALLSVSALAYAPKVTYADMRAANASCAGTTCTLLGTTWNCKGGGNCTKV